MFPSGWFLLVLFGHATCWDNTYITVTEKETHLDLHLYTELAHANTSYSVVVTRATGNDSNPCNPEKISQETIKYESMVYVDIDRPDKMGEYCLLVTPLSMKTENCIDNMCEQIWKIFNIESDINRCVKWNLSYALLPEPIFRQVRLFELEIIVPCGENASVLLELFVNDTCEQETVPLVQKNISSSNQEYVFKDLKPGKYCLRIRANSKHCPESKCRPRYTKTVELFSPPTAFESKQYRNMGQSSNEWNIGVPVAVVVISLVILALVLFWVMIRKRRQQITLGVTTSEENGQLRESLTTSTREILLLYSQETKAHFKVVETFAEFLRQCCHVIVHLDHQDLARVALNPLAWYLSKEMPVILIESEGAVIRERALARNQILRHVEYDSLDGMFINMLNRLANDPNLFNNYKDLLVVRFNYTPEEFTLIYVTQHKRYRLPNHCYELKCFLKTGKDLGGGQIGDRDRVLAKWEGNSSYVAFMEAMKEAGAFYMNNPKWADKMFDYE